MGACSRGPPGCSRERIHDRHAKVAHTSTTVHYSLGGYVDGNRSDTQQLCFFARRWLVKLANIERGRSFWRLASQVPGAHRAPTAYLRASPSQCTAAGRHATVTGL